MVDDETIFQKIFSLLLVLTIVITGFGEAIPAFAADATDAKLKKCKPVITEVVCKNAQDSGGDRESVWYDIHVDMPEYDNVVRWYISPTRKTERISIIGITPMITV